MKVQNNNRLMMDKSVNVVFFSNTNGSDSERMSGDADVSPLHIPSLIKPERFAFGPMVLSCAAFHPSLPPALPEILLSPPN